MKKIFFFFSFVSLVFAFSTYVGVGIGLCKSDKYSGFNFSTDFGYKNDIEVQGLTFLR